MRKLLFTTGLSVLSLHLQAVTLDQVYQDALMNDPQFSAEAATAQAGKEAAEQGKAALKPQVNFEASYAQGFGSSDLSDHPVQPNTSSDTNTDTTKWGVSAVQPLIDFNAWHSYKSSLASARKSELELEQSRQSLILRTAETYIAVLRAYDNLQAVQARVEAVQRQLEQTQQRFEVGLIAVTEVHETQATYDSAQVDLITAQSDLDIAFEGLTQLTGKHYDRVNLMQDIIPMEGVTQRSKSEWEDNALDANLDLKVAGEEYNAAESGHKAAKAGHYPKLTLSGNYSQTDTEFSKGSANGYERTDGEDYGWAINLTVPIYAGGSTSSASRQSYYQAQAAEMSLEATQRRVLINVRKLYRTITSDIQRVRARKQSIVSSRSALEATQAGYEAGTRNIVEVLDAQQSLYQAEGAYANARYEYVLNLLKFKQAVGMLNPNDVETLNGWLDKNKAVESSNS